VLLAFSPLLMETELGAEQHCKFFGGHSWIYSKSLTDVIALVGYNCTTNKACANLAGCPLIGCASHKLNLAVQEWIKVEEDTIGVSKLLRAVKILMFNLTNLKNAAQLRELTDWQLFSQMKLAGLDGIQCCVSTNNCSPILRLFKNLTATLWLSKTSEMSLKF
jgi:hypothetical protein